MKLGRLWWKRLGEKKIEYIEEKEIRKCVLHVLIFLGIAVVALGIFYTLGGYNILNLQKATEHGFKHLAMFFVAIVLVVGVAMGFAVSAYYLIVAGIALAKALIATYRFRTIFGFSPPVTDEGHKAVQLAVDRVLTFLAIARAKEYSHEKELVESIRANGRAISECENTENFLGGPLQNIGVLIARLECDLSKLEKSKRTAEKNYYKTRDAAQEEFLPKPFVVRKSFKDYLPKEMLQKLSQKEER